MAEVKWIKIVTDIFDDEKIVLIETLPKGDSFIVIWFKLLCLAGKQNNNGTLMMNDKIAYTDKMLASIFRRNERLVKQALEVFEKYQMIEILDNVITIPNWEKHQNVDGLQKIREQTKNRVKKHREKQKEKICNVTSNENCNARCNVTVTQSNNEVTQQNKNKKENKNIDIKINAVEEITKCYEENIGMLTPASAEVLWSYLDDLTVEMIVQAIKIATQRNNRNTRYIQGILNDWIRKDYKTLADIQNEQIVKKQSSQVVSEEEKRQKDIEMLKKVEEEMKNDY